MALLRTRRAGRPRRGAATVEMAVLLPLLTFLFVIAVDFARIFYFSTTVGNCARNGALWASDSYARAESTYTTVEQAALADAVNLNDPANPPTVAQKNGADASNRPWVEVTVSYRFCTITRFPGVPHQTTLSRTVRMATAPDNPTN